MDGRDQWPALPYEEWKDTCDTLHMWTQIVGKVKLELTPYLNEWWNVALYMTARGMTTGLIPCGDRALQVDFDFIDHTLFVNTSDGRAKSLSLVSRTVADFYGDFMDTLRALGIEVTINTIPVEVPDPIRFELDTGNSAYDPEYVRRWWEIQVQTEMVLQRYRSAFSGKSSPIDFFWGSFDLSHTRFSGRPAPRMQGAPRFFQMAEDQENIASGFWPGNPLMTGFSYGEPAFYSYVYPAPAGYAEAGAQPDAAYYDARLGEFILKYEDARRSPDPGQAILEFFQSTYESAANLAGWDRAWLERKQEAS